MMSNEKTETVFTQIDHAYRLMASRHYRPAAPCDALGTITVPVAELNIDQEIRKYASGWWQSEDERRFWIGCPNFPARVAMILTIEAARLMCSCENDLADELLKLARDELRRAESRRVA